MYQRQLDPKQEEKKSLFQRRVPARPAADLEVSQQPELPAAGKILLTLQERYGNRHVQRVVDAAWPDHGLEAASVDGSAPPSIQRQELVEEDEEELQMKRDSLQVGAEGGSVPPELEAKINRARGGGQPLDGAIQARMGESFGHDFSSVRVHTDGEADALNQQFGAKAFTTGRDIFFRRGVYDTGSSWGRALLAHELSHVMQQWSGQVRGYGSGLTVRPAGDTFEQAADVMAAGFRWQLGSLALNPSRDWLSRPGLGGWAVQRWGEGLAAWWASLWRTRGTSPPTGGVQIHPVPTTAGTALHHPVGVSAPPQSEAYRCGPACVAYALNMLGIPNRDDDRVLSNWQAWKATQGSATGVSEKRKVFEKRSGTTAAGATSSADIVEMLNANGANGATSGTFQFPSIMLWNWGTAVGHWMVATNRTGNQISLVDPEGSRENGPANKIAELVNIPGSSGWRIEPYCSDPKWNFGLAQRFSVVTFSRQP